MWSDLGGYLGLVVFVAAFSAALVFDLAVTVLRHFSSRRAKGEGIDPAGWSEYEAAVSRLRLKYRVKPARKPRCKKGQWDTANAQLWPEHGR